MYVNLDDFRILRKHDRVACRENKLTEFLDTAFLAVRFTLGDDALGAVRILNVGGIKYREIGFLLLFGCNGRFYRGTDQIRVHAAQNLQKATSAGVDNTCLLENRKHVGRFFQHICSGAAHIAKQHREIGVDVLELRATSHNGQNRTLTRILNRFISFFDAVFKCSHHRA